MQLQFRDTMYDAKSMPALQAIQQQLQRTEQEMAAAVEQVWWPSAQGQARISRTVHVSWLSRFGTLGRDDAAGAPGRFT